jgi:hypothetical protein
MAKYSVHVMSRVYLDLEIEAPDEGVAEDLGIRRLEKLLNKVALPKPLEWEGTEMWDIQVKDEL